MQVLVTGAAGFIGAAVCNQLLTLGHTVWGIDSLNDYYDLSLKQDRLAKLSAHPQAAEFKFKQLDIADFAALKDVFQQANPEIIIHLAAQAGVRYSLENPQAYVQSNLAGQVNMLECARLFPKAHFVYASSSSVYGDNNKFPFEETDMTNHPCSLYAATKKSGEVLTHSYCHLHGIKASGLRFFTVYGPWGRPDMAPMLFAKAILEGAPIKLFNGGDLWRDFTYIDDIVNGVIAIAGTPPSKHEVYNIGNNRPVRMDEFVSTLEEAMGKKAIIETPPAPPTEIYKTFASTDKLTEVTGYKPATSLREGLTKMVQWYVPWHEKMSAVNKERTAA